MSGPDEFTGALKRFQRAAAISGSVCLALLAVLIAVAFIDPGPWAHSIVLAIYWGVLSGSTAWCAVLGFRVKRILQQRQDQLNDDWTCTMIRLRNMHDDQERRERGF